MRTIRFSKTYFFWTSGNSISALTIARISEEDVSEPPSMSTPPRKYKRLKDSLFLSFWSSTRSTKQPRSCPASRLCMTIPRTST